MAAGSGAGLSPQGFTQRELNGQEEHEKKAHKREALPSPLSSPPKSAPSPTVPIFSLLSLFHLHFSLNSPWWSLHIMRFVPVFSTLIALAICSSSLVAAHDNTVSPLRMEKRVVATTSNNEDDCGDQTYTITESLCTSYDNSDFLKYSNPSIQFTKGSPIKDTINSTSNATPIKIGVTVDDSQTFKTMEGLGAGLSDSSAIVLSAVKNNKPKVYWDILHLLFCTSEEWLKKGGVGMNFVRTPIGATDFGTKEYTYADGVWFYKVCRGLP